MMTFIMCSTIMMVTPRARILWINSMASSSSGGQGPGDLQTLAPGNGQTRGRLVLFRLQVAELQHLQSHLPGFPEGINAAEGGGHDIFQHGHALEGLDHLKGTANAQMADLVGLHSLNTVALEKNISGSQRIIVIDKVKDGGLARAVGADQSEDLPAFHLEVHSIDCHETAEVLADLFHFK